MVERILGRVPHHHQGALSQWRQWLSRRGKMPQASNAALRAMVNALRDECCEVAEAMFAWETVAEQLLQEKESLNGLPGDNAVSAAKSYKISTEKVRS